MPSVCHFDLLTHVPVCISKEKPSDENLFHVIFQIFSHQTNVDTAMDLCKYIEAHDTARTRSCLCDAPPYHISEDKQT